MIEYKLLCGMNPATLEQDINNAVASGFVVVQMSASSRSRLVQTAPQPYADIEHYLESDLWVLMSRTQEKPQTEATNGHSI